jgi:small nuclear ribonucleoprotein (snRNP)-like protein
VLSDAVETIYDVPAEADQEEVSKTTKNSEIIFVRGDSVIIVSALPDE